VLRAALIAALLATTLPAAPHRLRVYPNSLTIFSIAQGPDGLLWLAAEDGLYRFDGFHYHKITSFPFASARFVAFTRDGSLWVADFEGLTRVRNNRFEVVLTEEVSGMAAYPDQVFVKVPKDLLQIGLDGSPRRLKLPARRDLTIDSQGRLWFACQLTSGCSYDPAHPDQPQSIQFPPTSLYAQVVRDSLGRIWAADPERAILVENGRAVQTLDRQRTNKADRPGPLLEGRNGQLWFLGETVRGLIPEIYFKDRADHNRFAPTSGLEDSRGHLWVASFGQGLVEWTPDPDWQRWFPEDFGKETPVQGVRDPQGATIVATQKNVYRRDTSTNRWSQITKQPYRYYALLPLENGDFLASINNFGLARISAQGVIVEHIENVGPAVDAYREIIRDRKGRLWVGSKRALLRLEGRPGSFKLRPESLPGILPRESADPVDMDLDPAGHLWVGYSSGLAWLDDQDQWHKILTDQPVTLVRSFALAGDDIWVAHRRNGAFSRLHRNGDQWNVTLFTPSGGYVPAGTEFLKRDSRGWIWRGTDSGVYVSDGRHIAPNDWLHIDVGNGLAANELGQYGFFEDSDGAVWITGDEGVTRFRPAAAWIDAASDAPPHVTRIDADGRVFLYPEALPSSLPAPTKVLRIDAGALNASPFRTNPLRYRFQPGSSAWQLSRDGSFEFHNLSDGDYSLEIGFTGNGPSPVTTYSFRVGTGRSATRWRWPVAFLAAVTAITLIILFTPGLDRIRFRAEKAIFLLRRRFSNPSPTNPADAHSAATDHTGETLLGRYRLSRVVSRGGFSVVYEARDLRDGNARLAVKVLNRNSKQEGWVRDRFAHEVAALRSVQHPGVVPILDSWISPAGEPCLAMPFLNGQTLRAAMEESPLSLSRAARIIRQLGSALADVHGRGIVHRDLKPENVILLEEQAIIIDFGTAGLRSAENELAATTLMSGSFHYMAPERLTGHYSPSSDIFSLAVIILEILTGKRLSALNAMFSDPSFQSDLETILRTRVDKDAARHLASLLAPAYNPQPRNRPPEVASWVEAVAHALERAAFTLL
jgi:ligand-binding sensor domain-containing protein/predicted Ser/Thr protein kinase